jgi:hypothetical protein
MKVPWQWQSQRLYAIQREQQAAEIAVGEDM